MLGLGDIVFPGFLIALLLRFDIERSKTAGKVSYVYFYTGMIAYAISLIVTGAVLHIFQAAQVRFTSRFVACRVA